MNPFLVDNDIDEDEDTVRGSVRELVSSLSVITISDSEVVMIPERTRIEVDDSLLSTTCLEETATISGSCTQPEWCASELSAFPWEESER